MFEHTIAPGSAQPAGTKPPHIHLGFENGLTVPLSDCYWSHPARSFQINFTILCLYIDCDPNGDHKLYTS